MCRPGFGVVDSVCRVRRRWCKPFLNYPCTDHGYDMCAGSVNILYRTIDINKYIYIYIYIYTHVYLCIYIYKTYRYIYIDIIYIYIYIHTQTHELGVVTSVNVSAFSFPVPRPRFQRYCPAALAAIALPFRPLKRIGIRS